MGIVSKLINRRCFPVKLGEETVHIRSLTLGEGRRLNKLPAEQSPSFAIGKALVNPDGSPAFNQNPEETDTNFVERMSDELAEVPQDVLFSLLAEVNRITTAPDSEKLRKN